MKEIIKSIKDFKIIPSNFKSAGEFKLIESDENTTTAELMLIDDSELKDYSEESSVEVFGVNDIGLVYFQTNIISRNNKIIKLALTQDFSIIQRREYSRVGLKQGSVKFKDMAENIVKEVLDISAGGIKIIRTEQLNSEKQYDIELSLSNNMKIGCAFIPVRTEKNANNTFTVSGKFANLENIDRIVLVQYAFKIKMEEQNKDS